MVFSLYLSYRHNPYKQSTQPILQGQDIFYTFYLQSDYHSEVSIQNSPWLFYILGRDCNAQYSEILNYWSSLFMLSIIGVFFFFDILAYS